MRNTCVTAKTAASSQNHWRRAMRLASRSRAAISPNSSIALSLLESPFDLRARAAEDRLDLLPELGPREPPAESRFGSESIEQGADGDPFVPSLGPRRQGRPPSGRAQGFRTAATGVRERVQPRVVPIRRL